MKCLVLTVAAAFAGCTGDDAGEFPVEPAGAETPVTPTSSTGGDTDALRGRVCISDDLLDLTVCRTTDLAGFQVSLGGSTAITDETGGFALPRPTGSLLSFTVSRSGAVTTTTPYSPSLTLPVIDADVYARALASNEIFAPAGTGAILGTIVRGGSRARGVTVSSTPVGAVSPFYDAGTGFGVDATGARGVFWLPGLAPGSAALSLRDATGAETTVAGVMVVNGGITILDSLPLP